MTNTSLGEILKGLKELVSTTMHKNDGLLDGRSVLQRGMKYGNIIDNFPTELNAFDKLLGKPDWVDWHLKGNKYQEAINCCAYCSNKIDAVNQEIIDIINLRYDKNSISALNKMINVFSDLEGKVNNKVIEQVNSIRLKKSKLQEEEQRFVVTLHKEASHLIEKCGCIGELKNHSQLK